MINIKWSYFKLYNNNTKEIIRNKLCISWGWGVCARKKLFEPCTETELPNDYKTFQTRKLFPVLLTQQIHLNALRHYMDQ